jgi:hypothetical protein
MIEYRKKTGEIYESQIPGQGIIIYRVIPSLDGNADGPPDEVYVFRQGASNSTSNGTINNAYFSSNINRTAFNDQSNPPCFLSNNSPGGIDISNISASGGDSMTFQITFSSYQISVSAGVGGTISPSGMVSVPPGGNQTFTFHANAGYSIDQVLIDGINNPAAAAAGTYTFSNVNALHTIAVSFACFQSLPLSEGFNSSSFPPTCWMKQTSSNSNWEVAPLGTNPDCEPYEGAKMLVYNAWNFRNGRTGKLITPKFSINRHNTTLSFKMYRDNWGQHGNNIDRVNFYLSSTLSTEGLLPVATFFRDRDVAPIENADDWYEYSVNLRTSTMSSAYVIIEGVSAHGNNIYLDDIQLFENDTPIDSMDAITMPTMADVLVYPNPTKGLLHIVSSEKITVNLYSLVGQLIHTQEINNSGVLHLENMAHGIYLLRISDEKHRTTVKRIVVQ